MLWRRLYSSFLTTNTGVHGQGKKSFVFQDSLTDSSRSKMSFIPGNSGVPESSISDVLVEVPLTMFTAFFMSSALCLIKHAIVCTVPHFLALLR